MQNYSGQRYEFKQQDVVYFHGGVRLYKNEIQMPYTENSEEKHYYLYDIEEYSQIEYTEKLNKEIELLYEENSLLKAQTEMHEIALNEILFEVLPNII